MRPAFAATILFLLGMSGRALANAPDPYVVCKDKHEGSGCSCSYFSHCSCKQAADCTEPLPDGGLPQECLKCVEDSMGCGCSAPAVAAVTGLIMLSALLWPVIRARRAKRS